MSVAEVALRLSHVKHVATHRCFVPRPTTRTDNLQLLHHRKPLRKRSDSRDDLSTPRVRHEQGLLLLAQKGRLSVNVHGGGCVVVVVVVVGGGSGGDGSGGRALGLFFARSLSSNKPRSLHNLAGGNNSFKSFVALHNSSAQLSHKNSQTHCPHVFNLCVSGTSGGKISEGPSIAVQRGVAVCFAKSTHPLMCRWKPVAFAATSGNWEHGWAVEKRKTKLPPACAGESKWRARRCLASGRMEKQSRLSEEGYTPGTPPCASFPDPNNLEAETTTSM